MDLLETLQKRYSCRAYLNKDVDDNDIVKIINYANLAPSAGNLQQWHVIVVKNKDKRNSLAIASLNQIWMNQAPVHLVICGNEEYVKRFYKAKGDLYCKQDCAAFIENILLFATDLGLSTCWVGAFDNNILRRELGIPEDIEPYAIVTLGYSNEKNPSHKKRYDTHTFTFYERYGNKRNDKSILPIKEKFPEIKTKFEEKSKNIFQKLKEKLIKHSK